MRHLVVGYHGTDGAHWDSIQRVGLRAGAQPAWLGTGVYFWEQDLSKAIWWATEHRRYEHPIAVAAQVDLTQKCLDLTTEDGLRKYRATIADMLGNPHIAKQLRTWKAQFPQFPDAFFLKYICTVFKYTSIRALVMKGKNSTPTVVTYPAKASSLGIRPSVLVCETSLIVLVCDSSHITSISKVWPHDTK
jgi:hypothetical protein